MQLVTREQPAISQGSLRLYPPTDLCDAAQVMRIAYEEAFGPVAASLPFRNEADEVALANEIEFGLTAYSFSQDIARVWRVRYGVVGIDTGLIPRQVSSVAGSSSRERRAKSR